MFNARLLQPPICVFGDGSQRSADNRFYGLKESHVYDKSSVPDWPTVLFVFPVEYRAQANQIFRSLRNGNNVFSGTKSMFGFEILSDNVRQVPKFSISGTDLSQASALYAKAVDYYIESEGRPNFAIIICNKTFRNTSPSPYFSAKAALASYGVPSQVITTDLLDAQNLQWALADIGLQIFVKLGGHPWLVKPSGGGGDVIVGVGRSEHIDKKGVKTRYVGYTTCFTSGGLFRSVELFKPHNSYHEYLDGLEDSLVQALTSAVRAESGPIRLVLHVTKRFSKYERERLEKALATVEKQERTVQYIVLRVMEEHPFAVYDTLHTTYSPPGGISIQLDWNNRLVVLAGRPLSGNIRKAPPSPLWVTYQSSSTNEHSIDQLVQQIYELSVANWRGFKGAVHPITIGYSTLISDLLCSNEGNQLVEAISQQANLRNVPWFI